MGRKGLIHLYTGEGKGKTTAAVGLMVRAVGNGLRCLFVQFLKGQESGEVAILEKNWCNSAAGGIRKVFF